LVEADDREKFVELIVAASARSNECRGFWASGAATVPGRPKLGVSMRTFPIAALLAIGAFASVVPDTGHAKLSKREFCAVAEYCRIPVQFRRGPFLAQPLLREMPIREIQKNCSRDGHAAGPFGVNSPVIGCAKFQDTNSLAGTGSWRTSSDHTGNDARSRRTR
jgi:hypothetical protein